jgi:hypothetical protein
VLIPLFVRLEIINKYKYSDNNYLNKGIRATTKGLLETVGSVEDNYYGIKSPLRPTFTSHLENN